MINVKFHFSFDSLVWVSLLCLSSERKLYNTEVVNIDHLSKTLKNVQSWIIIIHTKRG